MLYQTTADLSPSNAAEAARPNDNVLTTGFGFK